MNPLSNTPNLALPQVEQRERLYHNFFSIWCDHLRYANGTAHQYYSAETAPTAVMVLATTSEGLFVLNEEYRHPTKQVLLGCPGGIIDGDEAPLDAGRREFLEETGYDAKEFYLMGSNFPFPGITPQRIFYVRAMHAFQIAALQLEPTEVLTTTLKSYAEIKQKILHSQNVDGLLCTALALYHCREKN